MTGGAVARTPGWASQLSAGAPAGLVARVLALAAAPGLRPEHVRAAVAGRLAAGEDARPERVVTALERGRAPGPTAAAERVARRLLAIGARVQIAGHPGYPPLLAQAWPELGAPLWLFVRSGDGRLPLGPAVAVVGSRRPTLDGLRTAGDLGRLLAAHGVAVISGLARGIDQAAHRGALDGGGATVGVLGAGLDVDYPRGAGDVRGQVAAAGGLATELLPGAPPRPSHFLWRNRIVSGLADATVVVEGRARSGALQTARLAAAQGREVLAVPGSLNQPEARAPLDLIRDGARPVTQLDDVLDAVGVGLDGGAQQRLPVGALDGPTLEGVGVSPTARRLLSLLGAVPAAPGALAATAGLPVATVLSAVAELVASGLAVNGPRGLVVGAGRPRR